MCHLVLWIFLCQSCSGPSDRWLVWLKKVLVTDLDGDVCALQCQMLTGRLHNFDREGGKRNLLFQPGSMVKLCPKALGIDTQCTYSALHLLHFPSCTQMAKSSRLLCLAASDSIDTANFTPDNMPTANYKYSRWIWLLTCDKCMLLYQLFSCIINLFFDDNTGSVVMLTTTAEPTSPLLVAPLNVHTRS